MSYLIYIISFVICGLIQGVFSFGGGIFIIPVLSTYFDLKALIIPVFSLYNIFTNSLSYSNYHSINILKYKKLLLYGALGNIIGSTIVITYFSTTLLKILLAITIIIKIILSKKIPKFNFNQHQFLAGFSSGILGGSLSLGNLGLAIIYGKNNKNDFKSLVSSFCLFQNIVTLIIYIFYKRYSFKILIFSIFTILIAYLSQKIGMKISNKISNEIFEKILNTFLLIISVYLLIFSLL